jgi:hypothetical protein
MPSRRIAVFLEVTPKQTVASALDWPGWCRAAREEDAALQALASYAWFNGPGTLVCGPGRRRFLSLSDRVDGFAPRADHSDLRQRPCLRSRRETRSRQGGYSRAPR